MSKLDNKKHINRTTYFHKPVADEFRHVDLLLVFNYIQKIVTGGFKIHRWYNLSPSNR